MTAAVFYLRTAPVQENHKDPRPKKGDLIESIRKTIQGLASFGAQFQDLVRGSGGGFKITMGAWAPQSQSRRRVTVVGGAKQPNLTVK